MKKDKDQNDILVWPGGRIDFSGGCVVMGVLNVTPDSFSDGGEFFDADRAVSHGVAMARAGAGIIDVGAESTRPGSSVVPAGEQIRRAVGVIKKLRSVVDTAISIDTFLPEVAAAAMDAGANIINDITALADDEMAKLAAERGVPVVLMHMKGEPAMMQKEPRYDDVVDEVLEFLLERAARAQSFGIAPERIILDPGIGFGKTVEHNLSLLKHIDKFVDSGFRVLVGPSRKRFIGQITGRENAAERVYGTAATVGHCVSAGVDIVRVHDVSAMVDVVKITQAIREAK